LAKEEGVSPQNFLESKNHLAVLSGTSELSTPSIPLQHGQTRKYNDNYLVNSTAHYDLHDRAFLSIRQRASVLTIDFSFFNTFPLGGWGWVGGSGFGRIGVICISDNDGSACTGSKIPYGCIAQISDFLYMPLLPKKCFTFVWRIHVSSHVYYTSPWRLTRGVSTRLRLFASL
jgi:hypothetical protein